MKKFNLIIHELLTYAALAMLMILLYTPSWQWYLYVFLVAVIQISRYGFSTK